MVFHHKYNTPFHSRTFPCLFIIHLNQDLKIKLRFYIISHYIFIEYKSTDISVPDITVSK